MRASIVFMTGRKDPHLEWLLNSLEPQLSCTDDLELIVVDALGRELDELSYRPLDGMPRAQSLRPKPNIWQGPSRVTSADWWATANARNTGIVVAETDTLIFVDDRCWLGDRWLATVRRYATERDAVLCGSYDKLEGIARGDARARDHRRERFPKGLRACSGGWLYGCTFALPLEWALAVNGFEEGCDGLTGEDYIFGLMLANHGYRIDFDPGMFVLQDRTHGNVTCKGSYRCMDKGVSPNDKSHAALARFGQRKRTEFTPDLRDLRRAWRDGPVRAFPAVDPAYEYRDWYDNQLVREMV